MEHLKLNNIYKSFGGIVALDGVDFSVKKKSITGLVGPNGSGKTTLFNSITGFIPVDEGSIKFNDIDITNLSPDKIANHGIIRSFQIPRPFSKMTVLENVLLSARNQLGENIIPLLFRKKEVIKQETENHERANEILELLDLSHLTNEYSAGLSGGQKKLLELARILMADPEIILLDEPIAGVNPTLANKIFEKIIDMRDKYDKTFLIVEHNIDVVRDYCEYIGVMNRGKIIADGDPSKVFEDEKVLNIYLGLED